MALELTDIRFAYGSDGFQLVLPSLRIQAADMGSCFNIYIRYLRLLSLGDSP